MIQGYVCKPISDTPGLAVVSKLTADNAPFSNTSPSVTGTDAPVVLSEVSGEARSPLRSSHFGPLRLHLGFLLAFEGR